MPFNKQLFDSFLNINQTIDPNKAYNAILDEAIKIVDANFGSIYLATSKDNLRRACTTIPLNKRIRSRKNGSTYKALSEKKVQFITQETLNTTHPESKDKNIHNIMVIPLIVGDDAIGVITLLSTKPMKYDTKTKEQVNLFSQMASLVVKNVHTFEKAETSLEERDIYISMASHELKTPLTSISSYAQLSLSRFKKDGTVKEIHLQSILTQTERLNQLINDFLSLDNIYRGTFDFDFSEVSLIDVIESIISGFSIEYPKHKLQISYTFFSNLDDIWVYGDFNKLCQVFTNILNNAGKYSKEGTLIQIAVAATPREVTIIISDQGQGIPENQRLKIFDLFYRSDPSEKSGTGIGLFLAKRILQEHDGKIEVSENKPHGSVFTVTLPIKVSK